MSDTTTPPPDVVAALLARIERLEARVERMQQPPRRASAVAASLEPAADERSDAQLARMRATSDFVRQERLAELRANPALLAAIRARRAQINAFFAMRGLPPDPDPYPELP